MTDNTIALAPTRSDRDTAADLRQRMQGLLESVMELLDEANRSGLVIGFNLCRDSFGRNRIAEIQVSKPL